LKHSFIGILVVDDVEAIDVEVFEVETVECELIWSKAVNGITVSVTEGVTFIAVIVVIASTVTIAVAEAKAIGACLISDSDGKSNRKFLEKHVNADEGGILTS
jgi:hypothetical protein